MYILLCHKKIFHIVNMHTFPLLSSVSLLAYRKEVYIPCFFTSILSFSCVIYCYHYYLYLNLWYVENYQLLAMKWKIRKCVFADNLLKWHHSYINPLSPLNYNAHFSILNFMEYVFCYNHLIYYCCDNIILWLQCFL